MAKLPEALETFFNRVLDRAKKVGLTPEISALNRQLLDGRISPQHYVEQLRGKLNTPIAEGLDKKIQAQVV